MNKFMIEYTRKSEIKLGNWTHLITDDKIKIKPSYDSHEEAREACDEAYKMYGGFYEIENKLNDEYKHYERTVDDIYVFRIKNDINWKIGFEEIMADMEANRSGLGTCLENKRV